MKSENYFKIQVINQIYSKFSTDMLTGWLENEINQDHESFFYITESHTKKKLTKINNSIKGTQVSTEKLLLDTN